MRAARRNTVLLASWIYSVASIAWLSNSMPIQRWCTGAFLSSTAAARAPGCKNEGPSSELEYVTRTSRAETYSRVPKVHTGCVRSSQTRLRSRMSIVWRTELEVCGSSLELSALRTAVGL